MYSAETSFHSMNQFQSQDPVMYGHEDPSMYGHGFDQHQQHSFDQQQMMLQQQHMAQEHFHYTPDPQEQYHGQYRGGQQEFQPMMQQQHQHQPSSNINNAGGFDMVHGESNSMTIHEISDVLNGMAPGQDYFQAICDALTRNPSGMPTASTTLMIRNVPREYTHFEFLQDVVTQGFEKYIDFLYLPTDSRGHQNVGYAFLNFVSVDHLYDFKRLFHDDMLEQHRVQAPLVVIPSTTQGWRENVLKVIKNVVLRKQVPNDQLPLLFCKSSGEQFPFPVPSDRQWQGQPQVQGRMRSQSASQAGSDYDREYSNRISVHLADEFDAGSPQSRGSSHGGRSHESANSKCSSWESQKTLVEQDPVEALGPDASGKDAMVPEYRRKKEQHYREAMRYTNTTSFDALSDGFTPQHGTKSNFLDFGGATGSRQPNTMGRYSRVHTEASSAANSDVCASEQRRHTALPTKASDFFKHFGLECKESPHLKHIEGLRGQECCTLKEKGPPPKSFKQRYPNFARKKFQDVKPTPGPPGQTWIKDQKTPYFGPATEFEKSPSSKAAAQALKAAIMGTKPRESATPPLSAAAAEFCAVDVEKNFQRKWTDSLENNRAVSSAVVSDSDSSGFRHDLFAEQDSSEEKSNHPLWSKASQSLEKMLDAMAQDGDDVTEDGSESGRVPLFARSVSNQAGSQPEPQSESRETGSRLSAELSKIDFPASEETTVEQ